MDVIDIDVVKLFKAAGYESKTTGLILALLETQGFSEVECGANVLGVAGEHIESYRGQFRQALGITQPVAAYEEEEESQV